LPSNSSIDAPPPVETCDNFWSAPFVYLTRFTVSPPPITVVAFYKNILFINILARFFSLFIPKYLRFLP